jgi:hypothetical protein
MTSPNEDQRDSTAVWYFIAAVFLLTLPNLLFADLHVGFRIAIALVGIGVLSVGFVRFRHEVAERRDPPDQGIPPRGDD